MKNANNTGRFPRLIGAVTFGVLFGVGVSSNLTSASYFCPWGEETGEKCGSWTIIHSPGHCYYGDCRRHQRCRYFQFGNGPLLDCGETQTACEARLSHYGPNANGVPCAVYLGTTTVPCDQPSASKIQYSIGCPN